MCLALIAINQHPLYPLIILSNRDEYYRRCSASAHYWEEAPYVFAGKDLECNGTWIGVNQKGNFSLVTNYRQPSTYNPTLTSRGLLVKNYLLKTKGSPDGYIKNIMNDAKKFNLFNLIVGNKKELIYYSNTQKRAKKLTTGLYGLSNHLLDTPWYKMLRAKELFYQKNQKLLQNEMPEAIGNLLLPILEDKTLAPDSLLPDTGVTRSIEKQLSSIFVNIPEIQYGTRSSTLILFGLDSIFFTEKIFKETYALSCQTRKIELAS